jgi:hypothetical protein
MALVVLSRCLDFRLGLLASLFRFVAVQPEILQRLT